MTADRPERRSAPRVGADVAGVRSLKLRPGPEVTLLNISASGALVEGSARLLPGSAVVLLIAIGHHSFHMRSRAVRCHVSALEPDGGIQYHGAVAFTQRLALSGEAQGTQG